MEEAEEAEEAWSPRLLVLLSSLQCQCSTFKIVALNRLKNSNIEHYGNHHRRLDDIYDVLCLQYSQSYCILLWYYHYIRTGKNPDVGLCEHM